jgi:hypothetical protein
MVLLKILASQQSSISKHVLLKSLDTIFLLEKNANLKKSHLAASNKE